MNAAPPRPATHSTVPANVNPAAFTCLKTLMQVAPSWSTDRLEIAVAVAGAETGGTWNPAAHCLNCARDAAGHVVREDSRGWWQINVDAHPQYASWNLYDGKANARAMVAVSADGANWLPWTTYRTGSYRAHLQTARDCINATNLTPAEILAANIKRINAEVRAGKISRSEGDAEIKNVRAETSGQGDAVPQGITGGAATGIAKDTAHAAISVGHFLALLANGHTWVRVAYVVGGLALLVLGAFLLDRALLQQVAGTAVTTAVGTVVGK